MFEKNQPLGSDHISVISLYVCLYFEITENQVHFQRVGKLAIQRNNWENKEIKDYLDV